MKLKASCVILDDGTLQVTIKGETLRELKVKLPTPLGKTIQLTVVGMEKQGEVDAEVKPYPEMALLVHISPQQFRKLGDTRTLEKISQAINDDGVIELKVHGARLKPEPEDLEIGVTA